MNLGEQHAVLLGDSIFDNGSYVPGEPAVAAQLRTRLTGRWQVSLLAVDGDVTRDVAEQLRSTPRDASCLIISVGGNDALRQSGVLELAVDKVETALLELARLRGQFAADYRQMMEHVRARRLPTLVCTIYDKMPYGDPVSRKVIESALTVYNDVIIRTAVECGVSILDLRCVCTEPEDYSALSPIEPSAVGGEKIAASLARIVQQEEYHTGVSRVFCG